MTKIKSDRAGHESYPLVSVHWLDSYTQAGWVDDITPNNSLTVTHGILIEETKEWMTLAMTVERSPATLYWGNMWYIPRAMVKKVTVIQESPEC
jgi:hypothetical protein